jgi:hypothetical protein
MHFRGHINGVNSTIARHIAQLAISWREECVCIEGRWHLVFCSNWCNQQRYIIFNKIIKNACALTFKKLCKDKKYMWLSSFAYNFTSSLVTLHHQNKRAKGNNGYPYFFLYLYFIYYVLHKKNIHIHCLTIIYLYIYIYIYIYFKLGWADYKSNLIIFISYSLLIK